MLNKAPVRDDEIAACLRDRYGVAAARIAFLPLGNDSNSWVYRIDAEDGVPYFLKLKRGEPYRPSLSLPRFLKDSGIELVVAPLATRDGELWATVGAFSVLLYPFIESQTGMVIGLTPAQWATLGGALRRIHAAVVPPEIADEIEQERFGEAPYWAAPMAELLAGRFTPGKDDAASGAILERIAARRETIRDLVERAGALNRRMAAAAPPPVLCHADIHTANVLVDPAGALHIVDWDQPVYAPVERDLMFVLGVAVGGARDGSPEQDAFFCGYGEVAVDPVALAYYRTVWAIQDVTEYALLVLGEYEFGEETRWAAVAGFDSLFRPEMIVEAALTSPVPAESASMA